MWSIPHPTKHVLWSRKPSRRAIYRSLLIQDSKTTPSYPTDQITRSHASQRRTSQPHRQQHNTAPSNLLLPSNSLIPPSPPSPTTLHPHRTLIHLSIIHRHPPKHRSPRLPFPKHRRRITPKIPTIPQTPLTKRIPIPPPPPGRPIPRRRPPPPRGLNKRIHAQQPPPMLQHPPMTMSMPPMPMPMPPFSRRRGRRRRRIKRRAGRRKRASQRGTGAGADAKHVLVGGHGARDLDELHEEQHGDPGELERGPEGEEQGVGVGVDYAAEGWGEDVALVGGGGGEGGEICAIGLVDGGGWREGLWGGRTLVGEHVVGEHAEGEVDEVEEEVAVVVDADAVVDPGAVAGRRG